jgi:glycosyltransferase involved in cell wall biosynthesis
MVVHSTYPIGETRVQRQALALTDAGYDVEVLCLRGRGEAANEVVEGVHVRRLPLDRHRGAGMLVQLIEYLVFFVMVFVEFTRRHALSRYDSVQVHNLPDLLVFSVAAAKLTGTPVILDLHDLMPEFMASRIDATLKHPLVRLVAVQERMAAAFADAVVTVTDLWADTLRSRGVASEKIHVVMNVADSRLFKRESRSDRESRPFSVIYHGTLTYRYGLDQLIRVVERLSAEIPDVRLILHGNGEFRDELVQLVADLGLGEHVEFSPGDLEASELPQLLRSADVGVVPYRSDVFTNGILPTKLLEYVAVGIPAVVSDTDAVRRYFDADMVEYVPSGDEEALAGALLRLARDSTRRAELVERSDEFNQHHSWAAEAERYVALIEGLRPTALGSGQTRP